MWDENESRVLKMNGERKKMTRNISLEPIWWKPSKRQLVQTTWNNLDVNFSYSADRSWKKISDRSLTANLERRPISIDVPFHEDLAKRLLYIDKSF